MPGELSRPAWRPSGEPRLRLLTITSLYPNPQMPSFGIFVENRLRRLVATGEAASRVVAPVPWFFSTNPRFGAYADGRRCRRARSVTAFPLPTPLSHLAQAGYAGAAAPPLLLALRSHVARLLRAGGRFDIVDAQYYYPDGVAAAWLARDLGLPLVITARGTDINLIARLPGPRRLILQAAAKARPRSLYAPVPERCASATGRAAGEGDVLRNG